VRITQGTKVHVIKIILLWKYFIKEHFQKYIGLIQLLLNKEIKLGMKALSKNSQSPTLSPTISY